MSRGRIPTLALVLALGLASALAGGCGPIEYVNTVTRHADSAVDEARAANAAKWSPYYWTRAVEYLRLARIEAATADFQAANRFGRLSEEAAIKARDESLRRAADPEAARELEIPEGAGQSRIHHGHDDAPARPASPDDGKLAPIEDEP